MRVGATIAIAAAAASGACGRGKGSAGDAGFPASGSTPAPDVRGAPGSGHGATEAHLRCRAIAADGDVRAELDADAGTTRLANMSEIPGEAWLLLAQGARLVAKDVRTTRETTFLGPGQARACVNRREESWISAGSFESVVGAGESPGAEQWVVTPQAVLRYGAARLRVDVDARGTRVRLANGVAFLWPPQGEAGGEGWQRVTAAETAIAEPPGARSDAAAAAVDRCSSLAARSRELAGALLSPPDGGLDGGNVAAEQVTTRRLARAACAIAALRVDPVAVGESGRKEGLSAKVRAAEADWRALPLAGSEP